MKILWSALLHRATINIMSASATQGGHNKPARDRHWSRLRVWSWDENTVFGSLVQPLKNVNAELVYSSWRSLSQRGPWCLPGVTTLCVDPLVHWGVIWFVALQWNIVVYKSVNILRMHDVNCQTSTDRLGRVLVRRHLSEFFSERELTFTFTICCRPSVCCLSVVCNVRAPYSGGWNFRQYFYGIRYRGRPLTSTEIFMEIVQGEPLRRGS